MATYYVDASALVRRYIRQQGSRWVDSLMDHPGDSRLASLELVTVEVVGALGRAQREGRIGEARKTRAVALFISDARATVALLAVSRKILERAAQVAARHPLRTLDALHLAAALELRSDLAHANLPAPVFVSADVDLVTAARAEGLPVENPSYRP